MSGFFMNGELEDARRRFQAGIDEHNLKSQSEYLDDRYYMGQAHFYMGELARTDFRKATSPRRPRQRLWRSCSTISATTCSTPR